MCTGNSALPSSYPVTLTRNPTTQRDLGLLLILLQTCQSWYTLCHNPNPNCSTTTLHPTISCNRSLARHKPFNSNTSQVTSSLHKGFLHTGRAHPPCCPYQRSQRVDHTEMYATETNKVEHPISSIEHLCSHHDQHALLSFPGSNKPFKNWIPHISDSGSLELWNVPASPRMLLGGVG